MNRKGVINILAADKLMNSPRVYTTFLLCLLTTYTRRCRVGDWRSEAGLLLRRGHLLFNDMPSSC